MVPIGRIELPYLDYETSGIPLSETGIWSWFRESNSMGTAYETVVQPLNITTIRGIVVTPYAYPMMHRTFI